MQRTCAPVGRRNSTSKSAFTLIELLVVIAIIAILAAILLPVLASAKDKAMRTTCLGNQKQMALAVQMYAGDNRDYLAFVNWDNGVDVGPGWLYTVTGGRIPDPTVVPWSNNVVSAYQTGLWFQYMPNPKSYVCAVDLRSPTFRLRANKLSSYVMNGAPEGFTPGNTYVYRSCKLTDVWSPMCYLLWEPDENYNAPGSPGAADFNDGSNTPDATRGEGVGRLHSKKGGQILAIGSHVEFITREKFRSDSLTIPGTGPGPGGKTFLWWSPFSNNGH